MNATKNRPSTLPPFEPPVEKLSRQEVRCAVRFPLELPVMLSAGNGEFSSLNPEHFGQWGPL